MANVRDRVSGIRELLLSLLADLANDKNFEPRFRANHRDVHRFFWELWRNSEHKPLLADVFFDRNGNYPYSEQIDQLLQEFQLSGVLCRPNPTYKYNDITVRTTAYADELKKDLSPEEAAAYEKILAKFKDGLGCRATK